MKHKYNYLIFFQENSIWHIKRNSIAHYEHMYLNISEKKLKIL